MMRVDLLKAAAIINAVEAIDKCEDCDVIASLTASGSNAWVAECRQASVAIPGRHKTEFIQEVLESVYNFNTKQFMLVTVSGRQCCFKCFRSAYGFDKSAFSAAKLAVVNGTIDVCKPCTTSDSKEVGARNWCVQKYHENAGNCHPDTGHIMVDKPDRLDWYHEFSMDQKAKGLDEDHFAKPRTFFRGMVSAREGHSPKIMHRKHLPFARCSACHAFKCELMRAHTPRERNEIRRKRKEHLEHQYDERQVYYNHREKALKHPEKYMSIIIDGMDQAKLDMPHFARATKGNSNPLGNSLVGVLIHGVEFKQFVVSHAMKGGANEMMTVLTTSIIELQDQYRREGKAWPEVLYLQLDNTTKDNKNRALLTFLDEIVKLGVFQKVKVGFLYVGHTHEDIDQRFSVISRHLRMHDILTMQKFLQALRELNKGGKEPVVTARTLDWMYDFSPWALDVVDKRFEKFTKHHVFRFKKVPVLRRNENGQEVREEEVRMHVKEWARKKDGESFPYFPNLVRHQSYGMKLVNNASSKGGVVRYEEKNKIGIAAFEGKLDRAGADAKLRNVKSLAAAARKTWGVPAYEGVDMSPLVQDWKAYLSMLPLAKADVEYTLERPKFFPWPKVVARRPQEELRPDILVEPPGLRQPIQGSRVEGAGRIVVVGPSTGQGLSGAASEHAGAVAAASAARVDLATTPMPQCDDEVVMGQVVGQELDVAPMTVAIQSVAVVASIGKGPDITESDSDMEEDPQGSSDEEEEERAIYAEGENVEVRCDGDWYPGVVHKVRWEKGNEVVDCFHACDQKYTSPQANGGNIRHPRASAMSDTDDDEPLIMRKRVRAPASSDSSSDDGELLSTRKAKQRKQ